MPHMKKESTQRHGKHARIPEDSPAPELAPQAEVTQVEIGQKPPEQRNVGRSAAIISICTIISRMTGFLRTWTMAFALGATFLASNYQVANNLPNMLYELVLGGMLVTAFLPVYLSLKKQLGEKQGNAYASNILTIVVLVLGVLSILCMIFPAAVIYTQSFFSNQSEMGLSVFFFQFFAIQIVFYGASAIVSGLLNANREYFWPAIAPVFNNIIVIATFLAYAFVAPSNEALAIYIIAIGNPLGVFIQMAIQIPALAKQGIHIRPRIDFHDPGLRDTIRIGAPAIFVTICEFITVSAANAAAYAFLDNGPSVIAYARLWFTFPYSFLAVPVTTAMFTELADMEAEHNTHGVIEGIIEGSRQILFLLVPFALYLIVFAEPLTTLYHVGAFTPEAVGETARYLSVMAVALPFYGLNTYLQKIFSSIRRMGIFSLLNLIAITAQVVLSAGSAWLKLQGAPLPIEMIAWGTVVAYVIGDVIELIYLKIYYRRVGSLQASVEDRKAGDLALVLRLTPVVLAFLRALGLGLAGALVGALVFTGCGLVFGAMGESALRALIYVIASGCCALIVTFGPAVKMRLPEASFVTGLVDRIFRRPRQ